jgi:hypothetical protein
MLKGKHVVIFSRMRIVASVFVCLLCLWACSSGSHMLPISSDTNSSKTTSVSQGAPTIALVSNGGTENSFADANGALLVSDDDFGKFVDPQINGANRSLAISFLKMMPSGARGDFIYVGPNGTILSNRTNIVNNAHL